MSDSSLNNYPLVSVCIVTYNRLNKLKRCINSVLMQSYKNIEFVILDNCSDDGTKDYLLKLTDTVNCDIRTTFLSDPNDNAIQTINQTFKSALGEYILVMDDDAYFVNEWSLKNIVDTAMNYRDDYGGIPAIVGCNIIGPDGKSQLKVRTESGDIANLIEIENGVYNYYDFKGACALLDRGIISKLCFYEDSFKIYMNELDLSLKCIHAGYFVLYCPWIKVYHDGVSNLKHADNYLDNYDTVIFWWFSKEIGIKAIILNYFIVSYLQGYWIRNLKTTIRYIKLMNIRGGIKLNRAVCESENSIYNGMKKDILGKIGL